MKSGREGLVAAAERLPDILTYEDLQKLCRPDLPGRPRRAPRRATVEAWAKREHIPYRYDGVGGIWTTREALNQALGLRQAEEPDAPYDPEDIA
ncbi:hypothetical protein XthCFBP4691_01075 [Xanthomonas theicola]|uniref:DNA-binding protein n=2 Tax=Xanthomonas theicola TaxID=56464 RepID=A0A2S6ZLW7_9XANT|nr:hypothetical protein [Xanthomonas theicola]PPT93263.1 hypothetical protein XthCFBP4691_01075 [Xanthomonas theicola]QNH27022.1 hypothetical protein G4Q83_08825 [Xanthomonas theicola]